MKKPPPDAPDDVIVQLLADVAPYLVRLRKESAARWLLDRAEEIDRLTDPHDITAVRAKIAAFFRRGPAQPLDMVVQHDDATADHGATDEYLAIGTRLLELTWPSLEYERRRRGPLGRLLTR
ncbi:hypothetical protein [Frigoribacterium salinisoli]